MKLVFRKRDFNSIVAASESFHTTIEDVIMQSCKNVGTLHDFYTNPETDQAYSQLEIVDIKVTDEEFNLLRNMADYNNYTIETTIIESVKMYRGMYENSGIDVARVS